MTKERWDAASTALRRELGITETRRDVVVEADALATPEELYTLRRLLRVTQEQFAVRLGVHQALVQRWERGHVPIVPRKPETARRLRDWLDRMRSQGVSAASIPEDEKKQRARDGRKGPPPRALQFRCADCGLEVTRTQVRKRTTMEGDRKLVELEHERDGHGRCGPVIPHDPRERKPNGEEKGERKAWGHQDAPVTS